MAERRRQTSGEEIANTVTHVVGSHLGAAMLALLVWQGAASGHDVAWKTVSGAIFGACMILLYAVSSAYHATTYAPAKRVLHVMDHMAIFFLIAGSYTPFCLVTLRPGHPGLAWTIFGVEWGAALLGVVVGIGEIGLDFYWSREFEAEQKEAFRRQLVWASDHKLPLSLHIRNAYAEAIAILQEFKAGELTGVMHCFSGGIQEAQWAVSHGFALGIGGIVTFKNSKIQEIVKQIGLEHLVLETDAPYLAPVPHRGKPNESAYIPLIAQKIAELLGISVKTVMEQTTANALNIFKRLSN